MWSAISTLVAVFCHSVPKSTQKYRNNHKVYTYKALVTKQKKRYSQKCQMVIQKWALEKN